MENDNKIKSGDKVKLTKFAVLTLSKTIQNESTGEEDRPTLRWMLRNGYPRVTVFTSDEMADSNKKFDYNKMIIAPFDLISLNIFITMAKEVLEKKEKSSYREVNCLNKKFVNGERTNEMYLQATVRIGIDDEGVAYIVVMEDTKPKIKFDFKPSDYLKFKDENGDEITDHAKITRLYAVEYIRILEKLLDSEMDDFKKVEYIDGPKKKQYTGKSNSFKKNTQDVKIDGAPTVKVNEDVADILDDIL